METLRYVLLANGLLAVVSLAYYGLLRRETFFGANRLALWLGVTASLFLPLLDLPDWRPQPVRTVMERTAQVIVPKIRPTAPKPDVTITFPNERTYRAFSEREPAAAGGPWPTLLFGLYILGVGVLLVRFGVQVLSLRQLIQQSAQEDYGDFTLVRNAGVGSPFSFFGWVVVNPTNHEPDEFEQILRHERVHVRQWHSLDMLGAEMLCIMLWFNPAVYLFRHLLHQTLEFTADRAVLNEGVDAKAYQYSLVKVSLSAGQSTLTNHFSKSQLRSRIVMMNHPNSTNATWLKYPVLLLAMLTVATLFARPNAQTLKRYVPAPVAQTLATVVGTEPVVAKPVEAATIALTDSPGTELTPFEERLDDAGIMADSVSKQVPAPDSVRVSPSRYMQYEGNKLYWIVTPKTSLEDLAVIKREFARYGYTMNIRRLAYDPLDQYIIDISIAIAGPVVGVNDFAEMGVDGGPIGSHGGYCGLRDINNEATISAKLPPALSHTLREEEASVATFIRDNRMKYLMMKGEEISNQYGPGTTDVASISGLLVRPDLMQEYGVELNADSTIGIVTIDLPLFINNEPVTNNVLKRITVKNFSKLKISKKYGQHGQPGAVRALLFYTKEP